MVTSTDSLNSFDLCVGIRFEQIQDENIKAGEMKMQGGWEKCAWEVHHVTLGIITYHFLSGVCSRVRNCCGQVSCIICTYLQVANESCFPEHASLPDHSEWLLMRSSAWLNKCEGHFLAKVTCNANGILIPLPNVLALQKLPLWMFCTPCWLHGTHLDTNDPWINTNTWARAQGTVLRSILHLYKDESHRIRTKNAYLACMMWQNGSKRS